MTSDELWAPSARSARKLVIPGVAEKEIGGVGVEAGRALRRLQERLGGRRDLVGPSDHAIPDVATGTILVADRRAPRLAHDLEVVAVPVAEAVLVGPVVGRDGARLVRAGVQLEPARPLAAAL